MGINVRKQSHIDAFLLRKYILNKNLFSIKGLNFNVICKQ